LVRITSPVVKDFSQNLQKPLLQSYFDNFKAAAAMTLGGLAPKNGMKSCLKAMVRALCVCQQKGPGGHPSVCQGSFLRFNRLRNLTLLN
jgi:hypothetical protein